MTNKLSLIILFYCFFKVKIFYVNHIIFTLALLEETIFRYIPFKLFGKKFIIYFLSSFLYGYYAYFLTYDFLSFLTYFVLGLFYSFSYGKNHFFISVISRYYFILYILN